MPDDHVDEPQQIVEPPYFKITYQGNGQYTLDTNMGEYWKFHCMKLAAEIKREL